MYTVYILYSKTRDKFYIGFTGDDLTQRLRRHNTKHTGFTGTANDWSLMYSESYGNKPEALFREKQIKRWKSSVLIEKLIAGNLEHPD